jgi:hypothetical protein
MVVGAPAAVAAAASGYVVVLKDSAADSVAVSGKQSGRYSARRTAVFSHAIKGYAAHMTPSEAAGGRGRSGGPVRR